VPAGQLVHAICPSAGCAVPTAHARQEALPVVALKLPDGQAVHCVEPASTAKSPAWQSKHSLPPLPGK